MRHGNHGDIPPDVKARACESGEVFFKVPTAVRDHVKKCMQHRWPMYQVNRIQIDTSERRWQAIKDSLPRWGVRIQSTHSCVGLQVIRSPVGT